MWYRLRAHATLFFTAMLLAIVLVGCGNFAGTPPPNEDMIGNWTAVDGSATLHISNSGQINYFRQRGSGHTEINLPAKEWSDSSFTVGALGMSTDFSIDSSPQQIDGAWHVTVDGLEYTR